ncbi:MAG: ABC transporter ATP-binding protein [Candidatus Sedimenticola sp. (ex Thyasira tokunagai)]
MTTLIGENISVAFGGQPILQQTDIELKQGELLGLIGPNGAGKTTLLRILAGLLRQSSGRVTLDGDDLSRMDPVVRARQIAYLAQNGETHWPIEVERLVELGRTPHLGSWQHPSDKDRTIIIDVLKSTDTWGLRHRRFTTLSGGERMRVLIARALAVKPQILLADEPVAALDPAHQLDIMGLLQKHCRDGGSAVVVLHDLTLASHFCDRLQLLQEGKTVAVGSADSVLSEENLRKVYNLVANNSPDEVGRLFSLPWASTNERPETQR